MLQLSKLIVGVVATLGRVGSTIDVGLCSASVLGVGFVVSGCAV
jgi:hypothetical protein